MNNAVVKIPEAYNEPIKEYLPASTETKRLKGELNRQLSLTVEIPVIINGERIKTGKTDVVQCPHDHGHVLATYHNASEVHVKKAISSALEAKRKWELMPWNQRAAIFLKAADLISQKYSSRLNAATMLGQSKNVFQAEIDATCELVDFLRYNVKFMEDIYRNQPLSEKGIWNRMEYRALEGFVFALTPFNFTAIAGNLCSAPALMGNSVVWKPSSAALLSGYYLMEIFMEAGLPDGVINFIPGNGAMISDIVLNHRDLAGIHFTGSTAVFNSLWEKIGENISKYRSYPAIVGETGGKDYIFMHPSANTNQVVTAAIRGAFEYQGQKCSACSRMYIPESRWGEFKKTLVSEMQTIQMGSVMEFKNFVNAVIDEPSFARICGYIKRAQKADGVEVLTGGTFDDSKGYFVDPTVLVVKDPEYETMTREIFGPVLSIYVYPDEQLDQTLDLVDKTSEYALTGGVFASDRQAIADMETRLSNSAGNFYINDKPTGAVVGRQPFGGARGSGTNDKAGSLMNLLRWVSPRTIKENFVPPEDYQYPFMGE